MGLMDSLLGAAASAMGGNGAEGGQNQALQLAMQLIQQQGGVGGLMNQLQQGGLGDALNSWVSNGSNQSVSADQLQSALGSEQLQQAASAVGVDSSQAGDLLSQVLPQLINGITPNGNAADADGFGLDDIARLAMQHFLNK
ncbi:MAG: YidB family protein [Neisseria sp.]|uniref:YidB family protein n=1 Tax=Neisseria sp. TaxID=192066 RepID=UPI0026DCC6A9|nr:YidB family protein [Neisseria sp.]MDO4248950.1 YidB family protein [Neisseria sp.]